MTEDATRNATFEVDATDGGYIITAHGADVEFWQPTMFAESPGEIAVEQPCLMVNTLTGTDGEERVLLSTLLLDREMTPREIADRSRASSATVDFTLQAQGRLLALSIEMQEQGFLTSRMAPIRLRGYLWMRLNTEFREPDDPIEQHFLQLWPEAAGDRGQRWWTAP